MSATHDNRRWDLTNERMAHFNACSAQGLSLRAAADELGVRAKTVRTAAYREDKLDWLDKKFPRRGGHNRGGTKAEEDGPRYLTLSQIRGSFPRRPPGPEAEWLTKTWR